MANINDDLQWRGDLTCVERPFTDVDNVILSALAYLDFTGIVPGEDEGTQVTVAKACNRLLEKSGGDVTPYVRAVAKIDSRFVQLLADSRRFGNALLSAYVDEVDEERALQFAALQIDMPTETYVSFRGTDSTLVGWREDFMLSFTVTESQREAAAYLERAIARLTEQGRMVRVGGHSKGGNLAEYAAALCPEELRERIVRVYSNDGPGMAPEVMPIDSRAVLGDKLRRIVPNYSIIGMLFARETDEQIVVRSTGVGIGQHDPTTWQVTRSGVDEALGLQKDCLVLNKAIAEWAAGITLVERARAIDEVFDALQAGGATRFDEITESPEGFQQVLRALSETDERTRALASALVEGTVNSSVDAASRAVQQAWGNFKQTALSFAEDAAKRIRTQRGEIRVRMPADDTGAQG